MVGEITSQVQNQTSAPTKTENRIIQAGLNNMGTNIKNAVVNNGSEDAFIRSIPTLKTSDEVELSLSGNTLIRTRPGVDGKPSTVKIYLGASTRERVERLIREYSNKGIQLKMKFVDGGDIDIGHGYLVVAVLN